MTAEQHGAAAILLAEIVQVTKALHLPKEVIVEILQQELIRETSSIPDNKSP